MMNNIETSNQYRDRKTNTKENVGPVNRKRMGRRERIKRARDGLNENGPHMLIGSGTIGRCGLIGGRVSLEVGFEVSELSSSLIIPAAC